MVTNGPSERTLKKVLGPSERPYKCEICSKRFRHNSNLFEHRSVHTGFTPYACPYCGKACRLKGNLKKHMRTHVTTYEELEAAWRPFASREPKTNNPKPSTEANTMGMGVRSRSEEPGSDETGESSNTSEISGEITDWEITKERTDRWAALVREGKILRQVEIEDKLRRLLDALEVSKTIEEIFKCARTISFESFRCSCCPETFMSQKEYANHSHTPTVIDDCYCKVCQRTFRDKAYFAQHSSYHATVKHCLDDGYLQPADPDFLLPTPEEVEFLLKEGSINN